MALAVNELNSAVAQLRRAREAEQARLNRISRHLRDLVSGRQAGVHVPTKVTREFRLLVEQSRFNILDLVVTAVCQNLYVDGYRPANAAGRVEGSDNAAIWEVWQANRMDARQSGLFRAAVSYGASYSLVLSGDPVPIIRPKSPLNLTALYEDPSNDEWPELAMEVAAARKDGNGRKVETVTVWDDEVEWTLEAGGENRVEVLNVEAHDLGVTPIVRFLDRYDLAGSPGKVEPLIPVQQQLNQTTFSLLSAQQYGAYRQRWVTGMEIQEDENDGKPRAPFNSGVDTLWNAESPDTSFGEFAQTDLKGYLDSRDKTLLHVASVAQIPPHNLLVGAGISNISAEALAALEAGHRQDIAEHQTSFGESIEQMLRLAGKAMGGEEGLATWRDTSAQVVWRDTTPRSLAQVADALGKLAAQLNIPPRALWERIPGVTDQELARWDAMAAEGDMLTQLDSLFGETNDAELAGQNGNTAPAA